MNVTPVALFTVSIRTAESRKGCPALSGGDAVADELCPESPVQVNRDPHRGTPVVQPFPAEQRKRVGTGVNSVSGFVEQLAHQI